MVRVQFSDALIKNYDDVINGVSTHPLTWFYNEGVAAPSDDMLEIIKQPKNYIVSVKHYFKMYRTSIALLING